MDYILFLAGFVLLFASGHFIVLGGVQLAKVLRIPTLVVGLTIVSFGTSAPELLVSLKAALSGHPDISIGNVVGSNLSNMGLVLGLTALIFPLYIGQSTLRTDWPVMFLLSTCLLLFSFTGKLVWWHGLLLLLILFGFNAYAIYKGRKEPEEEEERREKPMPWYFSVSIIALSLLGLVYGAEWLVKGATGIARGFGVSERIISVSIIAFGTSVPELATSIVAALKKETDISLGNIIGSNIFNIGGILGITALSTPIPIASSYRSDMLWMLGLSTLLLGVMLFGRKHISRFNGLLLVLSYIIYMVFILN